MNIKKISLPFLLLSICLLISGCSFSLFIPEEDSFTPSKSSSQVNVTWLVVDNTTASCKQYFPEFMEKYPFIISCTGWSNDVCVIITSKITTHQILGHELRHCFEGNFHN